MSNARKLQTEIDRCMKKVDEGVELFDEIWEKVYSAEQQNQKEKYEMDLKKEIKKLQRQRDQIKTWISSSEVKDKDPLLDARKRIESKMEQFKICEKETKTKTYSKEGLAREDKLDPEEEAKLNTTTWLSEYIEKFMAELEEKDFEIEKLASGKSKKNKAQLEALQQHVANHKYHISKLEGIIRLVNNDRLDVSVVDPLRDDLDYYLDSYMDEDYASAYDEDYFYEALGLDDMDVVNVDHVTQTSSVSSKPKSNHDDAMSTTSSRNSVGDKKQSKKSALASAIPLTIGRARSKTELATAKVAAPAPAPEEKSTPSKVGPPAATRSKSAPASSVSVPAVVVPAPQPPPVTQQQQPGTSMAAILKRESDQQEKERQQKLLREQQAKAQAQAEQLRQQQLLAQQRQQQEALRQQDALRLKQQQEQEQQAQAEQLRQQQEQEAAKLRQQQELQQRQQQEAAAAAASQAQQQQQQQAAVTTPAPVATQQQSPQPSQQQQPLQQQSEEAKVGPPSNNSTSTIQSASSAAVPGNSAMDILTAGLGGIGGGLGNSGVPPSRPASSAPPTPVVLGVENGRPRPLSFAASALSDSLAAVPSMADHERSNHYTPQNPYPNAPPSYPAVPSPIFEKPEIFEKLGTDALFFIFYYAQGSYQQYLAARELKKQSWRFHKKYMTWFQRHEEPQITTDEYEQGTYVYFDYETGWCTRIKTDFRFEYSYLEDSLQ